MGQLSTNFPYVSLYESGGRWRITTAKVGGRRITHRLGPNAAHARRRAAQVSDWIQQWKSRLISEAKLLQLLGESVPMVPLIEQYAKELMSKGRNAQYVRDRTSQLKLLFSRAGAVQVKHLTDVTLGLGMKSLAEIGGADGEPLSDNTLSAYQAAAKQFAAWLEKKGFVDRSPLEHVEGRGTAEKVHNRRAPTPLELRLLIAHLWNLPRVGREILSGRDRAMLYLLATTTGLRVGEIRQVQDEWIDRATGIIRVPAAVTKNNEDALQPLPSWLLAAIDEWHPGGGLLFKGVPRDSAEMLRRDQRAARAAWIAEKDLAPAERERREKSDTLKYKTAAGHFDFHALRHGYVTMIGNSGATVKDTQTLARHSTPMLTLGTYSHSEAERLREVVDAAFTDPTPTKGGDEEAQAHRAAQSGV